MNYLFSILFSLVLFQNFGQKLNGKEIVKTLCSPEYFGRGYVNKGDSLAAVFLAKQFKERKIKASLKDSYLQTFRHNVNTFPNKMSIRFDTTELNPGIDFIVDPASGSCQEDWRYIFVQGKEVFSIIDKIQTKHSFNSIVFDISKLSGDSLKQAKALANALVQKYHIAILTNEKFTFSVANIQVPHAFVSIRPEAFQLGQKMTVNLDAKQLKSYESYNVIAKKKAGFFKKKTILITAHYDHLGMMGNQTYFPGANDNASGTSMLFNLVDKLQNKKLKYNIEFIAFAGEEAGLIGSEFYTNYPTTKLKNIEFVLNLDIMGSGEDGITIVNATEFPKLFTEIETINNDKKYLSQIKKRGKAANSDHYWFSEKGIPALFIYTMGPNKNYHDIFDTYENLSFNEYEDLTNLILEFISNH